MRNKFTYNETFLYIRAPILISMTKGVTAEVASVLFFPENGYLLFALFLYIYFVFTCFEFTCLVNLYYL